MMLSLAEAADRLGISRRRVRQLVAEGKLRARPVAGARNGQQSWTVTDREVQRFAALVRPAHRPAGSGRRRSGSAL